MDRQLLRKAGKLIAAGFDGFTPTDHARFSAEELCIGNWIYFARNVESPDQLRQLNGEMRRLTLENSGFEPFLTIDQEGGIVSRLHGDMNFYPGAMTCAAAEKARPGASEAVARITAGHLKSMGVNMNLAPVADINSNPANPIVGSRSYGDNPETVAARILKVSQAYLNEGIIPVVKHFPGHGDTEVDSHEGIPHLPFAKDRLLSRELIPFLRSLEAGLPAVMAGHLRVPSLDNSGMPASLSEKIIKGFLRQELGHEGLVLTDCLEMGGITSNYTMTEAVLSAVEAGVDLLFISHTPEGQEEGVKALYDAVLHGIISESRLDKSIARMEKARVRYCPESASSPAPAPGWSPEDLEELRQVSRTSLTLAKDDGFFAGLPLKDDPKLLFLHFRRPEQFIGENTVSGGEPVNILKQAFPLAAYRKLKPENIEEELKKEPVRPENWDRIVLICSDLFLHPRAMEVAEEIAGSKTPAACAVMRTPYEAARFTEARALILCYEDTSPAYTSLMEFLKYGGEATGTFPVEIPGLFA